MRKTTKSIACLVVMGIQLYATAILSTMWLAERLGLYALPLQVIIGLITAFMLTGVQECVWQELRKARQDG